VLNGAVIGLLALCSALPMLVVQGGAPLPEPTAIPPLSADEPARISFAGASLGQSRPTATPAASPTPAGPSVPADVPVLEGAYELKASPDGFSISYLAVTSLEDATQFYLAQLAEAGWEVGKTDVNRHIGGLQTSMQRDKAESRIVVSLRLLDGEQVVRVMITLSPR
jgi:hypothetical protein